MNKKTIVLLWSFTCLFASFSWGREGFETHGGSAVVCNAPDGTVSSVKLLDSYEAKIRYGLTLFPEDISGAELFSRVDERLIDYPLLAERINQYVLHFIRVMLPVPDGHTLKKIEDIDPIVMEDGCTVEQLAVYDETQSVLLYRESWFNRMSPRDQNALLLHEAIYAIARSDRAIKNSTSARHFTAMLISEWSQRNDDIFLARQIELVSRNLEGKYQLRTGDICHDSKGDLVSTSIDVQFDPRTRHLQIRFSDHQRCDGQKLIPAAPIELSFDAMSAAWMTIHYESQGEWRFNLSDSTLLLSSLKYGLFFATKPGP